MSASSDGGSVVRARVVLQQCLSARLMVQPASDTDEAEYVQIGRGLVVFVCFMKEAEEQMIDKIVRSVLGARLSECDGKLVSITELPGDVLVIPQATMGGALKGRSMQYHRNIDKAKGLQLYTHFVEACRESMEKVEACKEKQTVVKCGTYGNRQVLSVDTNGPYTHILDF